MDIYGLINLCKKREMKDKLGIGGFLKLTAYSEGEKIWEREEHNLIVSTGYGNLFSLLSGTTGKHISKVQIGTNSTAVSSADTAITNPVDLAITSYTASDSSLIIKFALNGSTGNGTTFNEFGLICADGSLFSRRVWAAIPKVAELSLEGVWTIKI
jgi:hypothetical protein